MKIVIVDDYQKMSIAAAVKVATEIISRNKPVLGLATGSTPEGMYARLVKMHRESGLDFSNVVTFNLDEYAGLPPDHPQSYNHYMHRHLFNHVNIKPQNIHIPSCHDREVGEVCREYEHKIASAGGIGLQVLGIGGNGHIGFNEPGGCLRTETHLVDLAEETITANSRFFQSKEEVPRRAVTMGVGSIMHAQKLLLLASGESKARAIKQTVSGEITTEVPASLLQLHRDITLLVDKEAASLL